MSSLFKSSLSSSNNLDTGGVVGRVFSDDYGASLLGFEVGTSGISAITNDNNFISGRIDRSKLIRERSRLHPHFAKEEELIDVRKSRVLCDSRHVVEMIVDAYDDGSVR